jgi:hypothetical protein
MFKNLMEFGYTRTKKEALGFYLAYLLFFGLISGLSGAVVGSFSPEQSFKSAFQAGLKQGAFIAMIMSLVLGVLVIRAMYNPTNSQ